MCVCVCVCVREREREREIHLHSCPASFKEFSFAYVAQRKSIFGQKVKSCI